MALNIKDPEADRLARRLSEITGETIAEAVVMALRERLAKEDAKRRNIDGLIEDVRAISEHFRSLPVLDGRRDDEIVGYDKIGIPR
jgi:antitoxin VapB